MITTPTPTQLDEIRQDLVATDDVAAATLQILAWLEAWSVQAAGREQILQRLVREAYELLHNPDTRVDLRDWLRAAEPFVRSER